MNEVTATRIKHRGKTAIRVSGVTREGCGARLPAGVSRPGMAAIIDSAVILGGARADRCDWVIVVKKDAARWVSLDEAGAEVWTDVPAGLSVHGVRACEAAAYAEASRLPGGRVIKVQD